MKLVRIALLTVLFVAVLLVVHFLHMRFLRVNVVFYVSIADAFVATALVAGVLLIGRGRGMLGGVEKFQLVTIWLLLGYSFAISVPTVIDRSLSFYILEKLQQRGGSIARAAFADIFAKEYLREHRLVDVRLTEQLESGTISIEDGCVMLTPKGGLIAGFGRFYRQHLLPRQRLVAGEYTDDLADPFRQGGEAVDHACRAKAAP